MWGEKFIVVIGMGGRRDDAGVSDWGERMCLRLKSFEGVSDKRYEEAVGPGSDGGSEGVLRERDVAGESELMSAAVEEREESDEIGRERASRESLCE